MRRARRVTDHQMPPRTVACSRLPAAAERGETSAIGEPWVDLHPRLLRLLWPLATESVAEDLASETWLQVACRLPRFEGSEQELRGWVFTEVTEGRVDGG